MGPLRTDRLRALRVLLIAAVIFGIYVFATRGVGQSAPAEMTYSEFKRQLEQGNVEQITVDGQTIRGTLRQPILPAEPPMKVGPGNNRAPAERPQGSPSPEVGRGGAPSRPMKQFTVVRPPFDDPELMPTLERQGVQVRAVAADSSWGWAILVSLLPWVLILGLLFYSSRRMQQQGGQIGGLFGFGKSRAKRYQKSASEIGFKDVAGLENAKRDMQEVIDYLRSPARYQAIGAKVPHGMLLLGPPGTGKTLLARAAAGEAHVPFFSTSGSEFVEMFVGVGASRVRDMFAEAKKDAPSIIFIDEIDSIGRVRGTGLGGGHDEREQTLNQILSEMDGFLSHEAVVVLAATNRPDVLDPALLRPGRFDRKITMDMPHREARRLILELHARQVQLAAHIDLDRLASATAGFSGADLANLINEAALLAARKRKPAIEGEDVEEARDRVILGERREAILSEAERVRVAYHESGHALIASVLPHADPVRKVTIIPRGMAMGATEQVPAEERLSVTRNELIDRLSVMLGGRAAELTVFRETTTGSDNDLKEATRLARRMVSHWGMSDRLGAASFRTGEEHVFLGREMAQAKEFSEYTARIIDEEIQRILADCEQRAVETIETNRETLNALARALLERETLDQLEIERIVREAGPREPFARSTGSELAH